MTLVHAMVVGMQYIDDADLLRTGSTAEVLAHKVMALSMLGHVRQLDKVSEAMLTRAWSLGAGPGAEPMIIDVDSTICPVYGHDKQGASFGYTKVLVYHPLVGTRADTGEVLHVRFRKRSAQSGRGRNGSSGSSSGVCGERDRPSRSAFGPTRASARAM